MRLLLLLLLFPTFAFASERTEVDRIAPSYHADVEVVQWDGTRIDMLTKTEAIEVDYAPKWAEAIGQSLYYAQVSDRKPAIVLLVRNVKKDAKYIYRCQTVCAKFGIKLYVERVE